LSTFVVGGSELGVLPPALAQDPDDVAAAFVEPSVERDEGVSTSVLVRTEAGDVDWLIVCTHNTLVTG